MVCPNCGRSIDTKTRFCKNCGTDLKLFGMYEFSRNKTKLLIMLLVIVAFVFVVLGVIFNIFSHNKKDIFMNDKNNVEKSYPGEKINVNINITSSIDIKIGDMFEFVRMEG